MRLCGTKKMVRRPSFVSFTPAMSPCSKIDFISKEHPSWRRNSFHLYGSKTCPINSGAIVIPPVCPWIARKYAKDFFKKI